MLFQGNLNLPEESESNMSTRSNRERAKRDITKQISTDTTTESENSDLEIGNNEILGPTTRKAWSHWCSNREKSSQSEDDNNGQWLDTIRPFIFSIIVWHLCCNCFIFLSSVNMFIFLLQIIIIWMLKSDLIGSGNRNKN